MIYDVTLTITHDYANPVEVGRHLLRVHPAELPGRQSLRNRLIEISPTPSESHVHQDFFGNRGMMVVHDTLHSEMTIRLRARVECHGQDPIMDLGPSLARLNNELSEPARLTPSSPQHFLAPSPRVPPDTSLGDYARALLSQSMTVRDVVTAVGLALNRDMAFDADATTVETTPQDAFAQKRGVCQDFSHIMISCLREIGVPAGYVSGYLRTIPPAGQPRMEGADAMHAWVRAWCGPEQGWIEYDPTNATLVGTDHIVAGYGRDYSDVSPVRGYLRSSGGQKNTQAVDVSIVN